MFSNMALFFNETLCLSQSEKHLLPTFLLSCRFSRGKWMRPAERGMLVEPRKAAPALGARPLRTYVPLCCVPNESVGETSISPFGGSIHSHLPPDPHLQSFRDRLDKLFAV